MTLFGRMWMILNFFVEIATCHLFFCNLIEEEKVAARPLMNKLLFKFGWFSLSHTGWLNELELHRRKIIHFANNRGSTLVALLH